MTDEVKLRMVRDRLRRIIQGAALVLAPEVSFANPLLLLGSLAEVESEFGKYNVPKHEASFDLGGRYANRTLWAMHGSMAACSWSSFQLMFPVAVEMGFNPARPPWELSDDEVAIHFVVAYIQRRILRPGASSVEEFADAYNSGSFKDRFVPTDYVDRFRAAYASVEIRRGLLENGKGGVV